LEKSSDSSGFIALLTTSPNISLTLTTKSPSNPQDELKEIVDRDDLAQDIHGNTASLRVFLEWIARLFIGKWP